jgi:hypothetical protein
MDKNIAFIFIGTKKYAEFFPDYYDSLQEKFIPEFYGVKKEVLVFTDDPDLDMFNKSDVKVFKIEHKPWPFITLKRFEFIMQAEEYLKKFSDIIFMDADMIVNDYVHSDFLGAYEYYFGVQHPGQWMYGPVCEFEKNPESTAYVSKEISDTRYRQGCFWGGKNPHILKMIETLRDNVNADLSKKIIAAWHDESHLNRFFTDNEEKVVTFSPGFAYPETWDMPQVPKMIIHKDKNMQEFPRFRSGKVEDD